MKRKEENSNSTCLTWLGSPGSACNGRAECRTETEFPQTSFSLLVPAHSPRACSQNMPDRSSHPYGNICPVGITESRRPSDWQISEPHWAENLTCGSTYMKSLVIRWEPLAIDLNSTPSKLMSWGRHHSIIFPAIHKYTHTITHEVTSYTVYFHPGNFLQSCMLVMY